MRDSPDIRCQAIAAGQFGLVTAAQARDAGMREHQIDWRVRSGRWYRFYKNVLAIDGAPPSWHQRLLGACLSTAPHGVASHRSAAALWGLDGWGQDLVEISVPAKCRRDDVVVHRLAKPCEHVVPVGVIPATDVTCTLLDLAAVVSDYELEKVVDSALRRGLTDLTFLRDRLQMRARRGRNGITKMRRLLDVRNPGTAPHESALEVRFARFVRDFGLPSPVPQHEITDDVGRFVARADFAYPDAKIAIELQSYAHHHDRVQWEKDQARAGALSSLGWLYYPVTNLQLARGAPELALKLRRVLSLRTRG